MTALERRLAAAGFVYPSATLAARQAAKVGLPLALAVLMQETGGGRNVFGHDADHLGPCPGYGWGEVTKAKYLAFRHLRDTQHRSNGVGPMQLTSPSLQDEADKVGGCWIPQHNIAVGLHYLHDLIKRHHGLEAGVTAYNGSGPAAEAYAAHVLALAEHYKAEGLGTVVGLLD